MVIENRNSWARQVAADTKRSIAENGWSSKTYYNPDATDVFGRAFDYDYYTQDRRKDDPRAGVNTWWDAPKMAHMTPNFKSLEQINRAIEPTFHPTTSSLSRMFNNDVQPGARDFFKDVWNNQGKDAANKAFETFQNFSNFQHLFDPYEGYKNGILQKRYDDIWYQNTYDSTIPQYKQIKWANDKQQVSRLAQDAGSPWIVTTDNKIHPNPFGAGYGNWGSRLAQEDKDRYWKGLTDFENKLQSSSRYSLQNNPLMNTSYKYDYDVINPYLKDSLGYTLRSDAQYDIDAFLRPSAYKHEYGSDLPSYYAPATVTLSMANKGGKSAGNAVFNQYAGVNNGQYSQSYAMDTIDSLFNRGQGAGMANTEKYGLEFNSNLSSFDPITQAFKNVEDVPNGN